MNSKELLFGLILVKEGKLSKDQLKKALLKQGEIRRFGRHQRLGEVVVKLGFITHEELEGILAVQSALLVHGADHTPLGLLLIEHGLAQPSQVYDALVERQFRESRLGELLIEKGLITEDQLQPLLAIQETEREKARAAHIAAGLPAESLGQPPSEEDFVILDAGGDQASDFGTSYGVAAPASPHASSDLLFKSYLED
jgi:hypothetical protein